MKAVTPLNDKRPTQSRKKGYYVQYSAPIQNTSSKQNMIEAFRILCTHYIDYPELIVS